MFELIFGLVWTSFSTIFLFAMNDENANDAPFWVHAMIWLFIAIGVWLIIAGIRKIIANITTATKGEETYGIVVDVYPSGSRVNGRPILNADIEIVEDNGMIGRYTESIGMSYNKCRPGDFLRLKHHKQDINILGKIAANEVPYQIRERLKAESGFGGNGYGYQQTMFNNGMNRNGYDVGGTDVADTIVINGIEYTRKK